MVVTDVRIKKVTEEKFGKLKAYVDITLDGCLVIHGLKLMEGENGIFVAMPSRKMFNNEYKDIVHPINSDLRKHITDVIKEKYDEPEEAAE
ncbi:MAG: septation regulator SpoVG [Fusobacterium gastrosuis]|uniref:septation regulator SpoVG n=1 Tax=Fusobacterium TaxID=848 RepID=UPI001F4F4AF8|nr:MULTISPECIES: septation regulator SpoVG [Fusobacterium]MDD7391628.1 septation regulator SpoVG [Fusobacteriaceae bacterium]MCI7223658.1 septation regulator SpoVG [Fusobacterium sp.]MDD7409957.1 septation regulator SpoVG [Fusobacteriaceae bacterium]MDY4011197.1 septation regulator SpoVG [Fusobacterium gastrosuis]MDY5712538.1 septation regulator SpoVG [Fusobacterium gastrosuis]